MTRLTNVPSAASVIRHLAPEDDLRELTVLIRAAYAQRAAVGLRYWATYQDVDDTAKRFAIGQGLVAEVDGNMVGTLTVRPPQPNSPVAIYREPLTWTLSQFAVLPGFQGLGLGRQLHEAAFAYARMQGGAIMALDTAAPATELIDMYRRWGYRVVGEHDWRPHTNYMSILMARQINDLNGHADERADV